MRFLPYIAILVLNWSTADAQGATRFVTWKSAQVAQAAERDAVLAVVHRMFDGMRTADSAKVRSVFATGARFASINARNAPAAVEYEAVDRWLAGIAGSNRRWDERVFDVEVRVDGNIAQVWTPYTFYLDGKVRHCGIDAIELLKDASGWKVTQLSDTRRTDNCRDVPPQ